MMPGWWVWLVALALYGSFRLFYDNWRGKLTSAEIDTLLAQAEAQGAGEVTDLSIVRTFLDEDDGREFVMVNLVRVPDTTVTDPDTGAQVPARAMMQAYTKAFMPLLLRHGGHPAMATRKVGGYVDSWLVGPDQGWSIVGFMRYRSRRDMLKMVSILPSRPPTNTNCSASRRPSPFRPSPSCALTSARGHRCS